MSTFDKIIKSFRKPIFIFLAVAVFIVGGLAIYFSLTQNLFKTDTYIASYNILRPNTSSTTYNDILDHANGLSVFDNNTGNETVLSLPGIIEFAKRLLATTSKNTYITQLITISDSMKATANGMIPFSIVLLVLEGLFVVAFTSKYRHYALPVICFVAIILFLIFQAYVLKGFEYTSFYFSKAKMMEKVIDLWLTALCISAIYCGIKVYYEVKIKNYKEEAK